MMRCSTCGERLSPDTDRCPTCGTAVPRAQAPARLDGPMAGAMQGPQRCPRCGYQGQGVPYFSRTGHVGLLIGVSLFTYGLGGLAYWLARRRHYICPNCGLGWEHAARALPSSTGGRGGAVALQEADTPLPSGGVKRRVLGAAMILFASFLIMMGIIEVEAAAVIVGSVFGAGGSGMFFWGWKALQERRQALTTGLQRKILRLATKRGGTLTVTEVAADLNLSLPAAEKVLLQMDDGFRVRSDVTRDGILLFEFPEVLHRKRLESGGTA